MKKLLNERLRTMSWAWPVKETLLTELVADLTRRYASISLKRGKQRERYEAKAKRRLLKLDALYAKRRAEIQEALTNSIAEAEEAEDAERYRFVSRVVTLRWFLKHHVRHSLRQDVSRNADANIDSFRLEADESQGS